MKPIQPQNLDVAAVIVVAEHNLKPGIRYSLTKANRTKLCSLPMGEEDPQTQTQPMRDRNGFFTFWFRQVSFL